MSNKNQPIDLYKRYGQLLVRCPIVRNSLVSKITENSARSLAASRNLITTFMRQLGYIDASLRLTQQTIFNKTSPLILRAPRLFARQLRKIIVIQMVATLVRMTGCNNITMQKQDLSISTVNFKPAAQYKKPILQILIELTPMLSQADPFYHIRPKHNFIYIQVVRGNSYE